MTGVAELVVGLVLVVGAADVFLDGLLGASARWRLSPFVLTVVLSGLELENLAAGLAANAHGLPDAAAGTFLGGTTFLALAVAGLGAVVAPMPSRLPRPAIAWTAAAPLPLLLFASDGRVSRAEGALLLGWSLFALLAIARSGRALPVHESVPAKRWTLLRLVGGLAVLTGAGDLLGAGIKRVVFQLHVPETLLGNTAIAASVEAEELGRVLAPARRGRSELALANVTATIVHFVALNAGIIALARPLALHHSSVRLHLPVAVGATLLLTSLLATRRQLGRPEGAILLSAYAAYIAAAIISA